MFYNVMVHFKSVHYFTLGQHIYVFAGNNVHFDSNKAQYFRSGKRYVIPMFNRVLVKLKFMIHNCVAGNTDREDSNEAQFLWIIENFYQPFHESDLLFY